MEWGSKLQGIFVKPVDDLLGTSCGRFISPLVSDRHFKPLAPVAFHQMVTQENTAPGASGLKVAFFVGCVIDKMFPHMGEAVLRVPWSITASGCISPPAGCCGIPALSSGDTQTFNDLVAST